MKKVIIAALSVMLFALGAGSAFAAESKLDAAVKEVVGTPYKYGGTTTKGFDCSGFVRYIFDQFGVDLPRTSSSQAEAGDKVEKEDLRPGDLVFFNTSGAGISHAGIYLGDGKFAHSSSSKGVTISNMSDSYYEKRYVTASRFLYGDKFTSITEDQ